MTKTGDLDRADEAREKERGETGSDGKRVKARERENEREPVERKEKTGENERVSVRRWGGRAREKDGIIPRSGRRISGP